MRILATVLSYEHGPVPEANQYLPHQEGLRL